MDTNNKTTQPEDVKPLPSLADFRALRDVALEVAGRDGGIAYRAVVGSTLAAFQPKLDGKGKPISASYSATDYAEAVELYREGLARLNREQH